MCDWLNAVYLKERRGDNPAELADQPSSLGSRSIDMLGDQLHGLTLMLCVFGRCSKGRLYLMSVQVSVGQIVHIES